MNNFLEKMAVATYNFIEQDTKCGVQSALILSSSKEFDSFMVEKYNLLGEQNVYDCKEIYVVRAFPNGDDDKYDVDELISLAKSISSSVQVKYVWYDVDFDVAHLDCTKHTLKVTQKTRGWKNSGCDMRDLSRSSQAKTKSINLSIERKLKGGRL